MKGPVYIRPFRAAFGDVAKEHLNHYCYRFEDGSGYLWFSRKAHHPGEVGDIVVSSFPNCNGSPITEAKQSSSVWKTDRQVGIGSTKEAVVSAYGPPAKTVTVEGSAYRWVIQGDYIVSENRYKKQPRPELGELVLVYCSDTDFRSAGFGIKDGRVVWIALSNSE